MFALNKSAFVVLEAALSLNISDDLEYMVSTILTNAYKWIIWDFFI